MLECACLLTALAAIAIYRARLHRSLAGAVPLQAALPETTGETPSLPTISVIIPAYNEADNIVECVAAVLDSTSEPSLEVWVIDDGSSDETLALARQLQALRGDRRLQVVAGAPRPESERWVGKNWACYQGARRATGDWLLFLDADVRLQPGAIALAARVAVARGLDLLSLLPGLTCGCWAEWLVQPLMANNLAVGGDYAAVNDRESEVAFAAGPFMCFRRQAYERLGGHQAVRAEVVEDVMLARRVKENGCQLGVYLGTDWVSVRMYRSWGALWEGWTKNLYLGMGRRWQSALKLAGAMLLIYAVPWLGLLAAVLRGAIAGFGLWEGAAIALFGIAIGFHYDLRRTSGIYSGTPLRYWWLSGVGGVAIALMVVASVVKTETGWGWTWRGRSLSLPS